MSHLKSRVGDFTFHWKSTPRGSHGTVCVETQKGEKIDVSWKRDANGIWMSLPNGLFGFDLVGNKDDDGQVSYDVYQRGRSLQWSGVSSHYGDRPVQVGERAVKNKNIKIRAQMPGKIVRVLSEVGKVVAKDEPLMVMEAMKMENEIRAPRAGKIVQIKAVQGQAVETGADLILIEAE